MIFGLNSVISSTKGLENSYRPFFYRIGIDTDRQAFDELLESNKVFFSHDRIQDQLKELVKSKYPAKRLTPEDIIALVDEHTAGIDLNHYGVWVYYPWSGRLVHTLDADEYAEMRTNRNRYKITREEQQTLAQKKIGIIGLSVGQSIAVTLAMERGFGELRLADFDTLDLSNLNRIRTGIHNLGINKTYITAREIAEIDPFLNVKCYDEGLSEENIDTFLTDGGKLDLLIDECDGLDIKIQCRYRAREMRIPVLMDTSDRGMLDVERFDLEPERPILHGLAGNIDPKSLSELSNEDKVPIVLQIAGGNNISSRGRASMIEVSQTISTWPQLATSVILGGAVGADVSRRILLDQFRSSGRYYIDLDQLIADKKEETKPHTRIALNPYQPLTETVCDGMIAETEKKRQQPKQRLKLTTEQINKIVEAGNLAPSTGNDQPWKWVYKDGSLYLFHDRYYSFSFGDYRNIASYLTFGAVYENVVLQAQDIGIEVAGTLFPLSDSSPLIAIFDFSGEKNETTERHVNNQWVKYIPTRCTNRILTDRKEIPADIIQDLKTAAESVEGASCMMLTDLDKIKQVAKIIASCDRMRLLNEEGHYDFVHREMRWTPEDSLRTKAGIDVRTLGLSQGQLSALEIIKDYNVIEFVANVKGGGLFEAATTKSVSCSSAMAFITMPSISAENYIIGGRAYERLWLAAEQHDLAVHPVISPLYFFPRLILGNGEGLSQENIEELKKLRKEFKEIFGIGEGLGEIFLTKLAYAPKPEIKLPRKPLDEVLFVKN